MRNRLVRWITATIALGTSALPAMLAFGQGSPDAFFKWRPVAIGAGGQLTGIDIVSDGTKVVKADTFGAYIWDEQLGRWSQLITASSWGAMEVTGASGVWEIRIAPSETSRLYMIVSGYTYRSDDKGKHWLKTSLPLIASSVKEGGQTVDANGPFKFANQKMAVDPANPDVVYVGTPNNGIWRTFDAGATWMRVGEISASESGPGSAGIAFDLGSGASKGKTNTIFVPSYGKGVWQSKDAGATWTKIADGAGLGGPANVWSAQVGSDGVYWCTDQSNAWKYQNGAWTALKDHVGQPMKSIRAVAVDTRQPGRVVFVTDTANSGFETIDNGATLVGRDKWFGNYPRGHGQHAPTDIAWLRNSDTSYMTLGDARFDPSGTNKLYFSEGIGVWWTNWPINFSGSAYYSQSVGIEELVAHDIIAPLGAKPIVGVWDRGVFRIDDPEKYPSRYYLIDGSFTAGWALDYASADPTFVATLNNWPGNYQSGYSNDSGTTWHSFGMQPDSQRHGGCIAVSTSSNFVVVPANNGFPVYSKDGGSSWKSLVGNEVEGRLPKDGWITAYYLNSHIVAADRVNIGTFYIYNFIHGVYRTTDGGDHWARVHKGPVASNSGWNARLRTAPGYAGHLWYTSGPGSGASGQLMRSKDGGETWIQIPRLLNVVDFGFGKSKSANGYPAIFIVGRVSEVFSIWRSDDEGRTWTNLGRYPNGNVDYVKTINGDMNTFGTVYVGFGGSGFSYGILNRQ